MRAQRSSPGNKRNGIPRLAFRAHGDCSERHGPRGGARLRLAGTRRWAWVHVPDAACLPQSFGPAPTQQRAYLGLLGLPGLTKLGLQGFFTWAVPPRRIYCRHSLFSFSSRPARGGTAFPGLLAMPWEPGTRKSGRSPSPPSSRAEFARVFAPLNRYYNFFTKHDADTRIHGRKTHPLNTRRQLYHDKNLRKTEPDNDLEINTIVIIVTVE